MKLSPLLLTLLLSTIAFGLSPVAASDRIWFGGGLGLSFGDVDYIEVAPLVGYSATPKLSVGGGLTYRYRKDSRYPTSLTTNDYGGNVFARYRVYGPLFAHAEYEYLSYEYVRADLSTDRDAFNSVMAGGGFHQPAGSRASLFFLALYNFSYDSGELRSPYDSPWIYRVGVSVGF